MTENNCNLQNGLNNRELRDDLKAVTFTIIFETSALNRDEKLGGNIPSIKKLTRFGNKTFSYLSRVAMRHYLFETLSKTYKCDWAPANCFESGTGDNKVVQFDLRNQNILTHGELDAFGYMFTIGGQSSITRKAAVGITKAIALETWEGDMQFNANHDLASRCGANPNPVNKEEQESFFKVSFTVDIEKLGNDEWWIKDHNYDDTTKRLTLFLSEKGVDITLKDVEVDEEESKYKSSGHEIKIDGLLCNVSKELIEEKTEKAKKNQEEKKFISFKKEYLADTKEEENQERSVKGKKGKVKPFKIYEGGYDIDDEENSYRFAIGKQFYDVTKKTLTLSLVLAHSIDAEKIDNNKYEIIERKDNKPIGQITIKTEDSRKKAIFNLDKSVKTKRICQILDVLKNGLIYHTSGENYGIVPQFIIAAGLKLPIPLFNSFVDLGSFEKSILDNGYILNKGNSDNKKIVYVYNPKNLTGEIDTSNLHPIWDEFLETLGVKG